MTDTITVPEIAFTGDTMSDFIMDDENLDALNAKILILEVLLSLDSVHHVKSVKRSESGSLVVM